MNLKQKLISLITAMTMIMPLFSAMPITAGAAEHIHPVCGKTCAHTGDEAHEDITWTAWENGNLIPTEAGNYYLTKDITLQDGTQISGNTKICLNGHTITQNGNFGAITIASTGNLDLCDCSAEQNGKVTAGEDCTYGLVTAGGAFNLYSGNITGSNDYGISTSNEGGTINMYGGKVTANKQNGISTSADSAVFNMYGGEISGNSGSSGGVYIFKGSFNMLGGKITGNEARLYGGGIHVADTAKNVVIKGEVIQNKSELYGGGICTSAVIRIMDAKITGNTATYGGGVCGFFSKNPIITVGGNTVISQNTVTDTDTASNLMVFAAGKIAVDNDTPFKAGADIGVSYYYSNNITEATPFNITGANNTDCSKYFKSDDANYVIKNLTDNTVQLAKIAASPSPSPSASPAATPSASPAATPSTSPAASPSASPAATPTANPNQNVVIDIKPGTPNITVDGLEEIINEEAPSASSITVKMTIESKEEDSSNEEHTAIKLISGDSENIDYLDISLIKTVDSKESAITETSKTIKIVIPFDKAGKKNIKVYRYHGGSAELLSDNTENDEYYAVGDGIITVYAKKFSTYAIGYDIETTAPTVTPAPTKKPHRGGSSLRSATPRPTATPKPTQTPEAKPTQEPEPEVKQHKAYIVGYEGKFNPDGNITRAETAAILARLTNGFEENKSYTASFDDVSNELWYYRYIGFEESQNTVTGYQDGTFRPENSITRAEFASMITRFAKLNASNAYIPFADTDGHWASEQISACYEAGYIKGYEDNTFLPDNYVTRAEAVAIINRILDRNDIKEFDNPFSDVLQSHWAYTDIMEAAILIKI